MNKYFLQIFIGFGFMVILVVIAGGYEFDRSELYLGMQGTRSQTEETMVIAPIEDVGRTGNPDAPIVKPVEKLKADLFTGKLEKVNTGCFADGECFVEVDGKHVTALRGWSQDTVGKVIGVDGFGDLEKFIGKDVEVYAQVNPDGTYTLYGSEGFYIKPLKKVSTPTSPLKPTGGCIIGGCSAQLCVDAKEGETMSTCEYREEYACYKTAQCERQTSGQCGWTETPELLQCLSIGAPQVEMI